MNEADRNQRDELAPGWLAPPQPERRDGKPRHVGIELEFAAVSCVDAARLVNHLYGGALVEESPYRLKVNDTAHGDYLVELDTQYAHPDDPSGTTLADKIDGWLSEIVGRMTDKLVPAEIVTPPLSMPDMPDIDRLVDGLRKANAADTTASVFYGFGLHLNPEVPDEDFGAIYRYFQAYLILANWLRGVIGLDATRRLLPFSDPFPSAYVALVLKPERAPPLDRFAADYLRHNPTRNRELDLLPLIAHLDDGLLDDRIDRRLVKPRPTFHYRLPDCRLSDPDWGVAREWNRWVMVERLANDPDSLAELRGSYGTSGFGAAVQRWIDRQA